MTREEILEQSRKSGKGVHDERELQLLQKAKAISQGASLLACMLLSLACVIWDGPMLISNTAWTIVSVMYAAENMFLTFKLKKSGYWVLTVIWVLAFFAYMRVIGNAFV